MILVIPTNIRLSFKGLPRKNTFAYLPQVSVTTRLTTDIIKPSFFGTYVVRCCFVPGKTLQPSSMLANEARANPIEAAFRSFPPSLTDTYLT